MIVKTLEDLTADEYAAALQEILTRAPEGIHLVVVLYDATAERPCSKAIIHSSPDGAEALLVTAQRALNDCKAARLARLN